MRYQAGPGLGEGVIVTCFGIAFIIPEPFFIEEGVCTLIALGFVVATPVIAEPVVDAIDELIDIANEAWENWQPENDNDPDPQVTPIPFPYQSTPTPPTPYPDDDERDLHIALGLNITSGGRLLLLPFTWNLNDKLNSQNIYVYSYGAGPRKDMANGGAGNWHEAGLSDDPPSTLPNREVFFQSFRQAVENAKGIHFNLENINNPVQWADTAGAQKKAFTAYELHYIRTVRPELCTQKTKFYDKGSGALIKQMSVQNFKSVKTESLQEYLYARNVKEYF